jgi:hypothetical protein
MLIIVMCVGSLRDLEVKGRGEGAGIRFEVGKGVGGGLRLGIRQLWLVVPIRQLSYMISTF